MVRIKSIFAALAALLAIVVAVPGQASAGFGHHHRDGWGEKRVQIRKPLDATTPATR